MDQNNNLYQIENLPRQNENFIFSNNIIIMDQNNNSYENENFNNSDIENLPRQNENFIFSDDNIMMDTIEYYKHFDNKAVSFIYRPNGEIYPEDACVISMRDNEKKKNNNTLLEKLREK